MKNILLTFLLLFSFHSFTQVPEIISQNCYLVQNGLYASMTETNNGYILALDVDSEIGHSNFHGASDIWLVKFDSVGNVLWEKCYGGSSHESPQKIVRTDNDNYFILGGTQSTDGDIVGNKHRWVFKINGEGDILMSNTYGNSSYEEMRDIIPTPDGGFVFMTRIGAAGGDVSTYYGYGDVWLCKCDSTGNIEWEQTYGGPLRENGLSISLTSENHIIMVGAAQQNGYVVDCDLHGGLGDVWLLEVDLLGNVISQHCYGGSDYEFGISFLELEEGYIIAGKTYSDDGDVSGFHGEVGELGDIWLLKLDNQFEIEWQKCIGGTGLDGASYLSQDEDGSYTIIGWTTSHDGDVVSENHSTWANRADVWVVKTDSQGEILWEHCYGGEREELFEQHRVVKKSDYNYIVAANSNYMSGDVECGNTDPMDNYVWLIELKDCDHYQTTIPATPTGADTLCVQDSIAYFTTGAVEFAGHYAWLVSPPEAGTITGDSLQATYHINPDFQGTVTITVKAVNDCGQSDWSDPKYVEIQNCLGIQDNPYASLLRVYPNPANDYIIFSLNTTQSVKTKITITNLFGQEVAGFPLKKQKTKWNLKGLAKGVYFYHSVVEGENVFGKIIVR